MIEDFAIYYNGPSGAAQVIVDVVGYFVENKATALQCVHTLFTNVTIPHGSFSITSIPAPACPTGYTRTGLDCNIDIGGNAVNLGPDIFGDCKFNNPHAGDGVGGASAVCCRVPGL